MNDVFAVFVTFHPDAAVSANVRTFRAQGARVILVDNGSRPDGLSLVRELARAPGISLIENGANLGVATALNIGVRRARAEGAAWIFTFDQDSLVTPDYVPVMLSEWTRAEQSAFAPVGLLTPIYFDQKTGYGMSAKFTSRERLRSLGDTMTSGTLMRAELADEVGLFDDGFFIDCVDVDFCLRVRRAGLSIVQTGDAKLYHNLGEPKFVPILWKKIGVSNHSAFRRYYIVRNRFRTWARHGAREPEWLVQDVRRMVTDHLKVALFETDKSAKLGASLQGAIDAVLGREGPGPLR